MEDSRRFLASSVCVGVSMLALFLLPLKYFVPLTFAATSVMIVATYALGAYQGFRPRARSVALGLVSALVLYGLFFAGNLLIAQSHVPGMGASNAASIYRLVASPSNPLYLQVGILLFDAAGYESFFRGVVQGRMCARFGPLGVPGTALIDAAMHLATLNPLWVATTFVADLVWGLTFYYAKDLSGNLTSHFVWDLAIFVVRPIV